MFLYNKLYCLYLLRNNYCDIHLNKLFHIFNIFRNDVDIIIYAVNNHYYDFKSLSNKLQNNRYIVLYFVNRDYKNFQYISKILQKDIEIATSYYSRLQ